MVKQNEHRSRYNFIFNEPAYYRPTCKIHTTKIETDTKKEKLTQNIFLSNTVCIIGHFWKIRLEIYRSLRERKKLIHRS